MIENPFIGPEPNTKSNKEAIKVVIFASKIVESKFPENKKTTSRIITILKKNKEMTDPESFTMAPNPPTYSDYQKIKLRESATKYFKKPVQIKSWHKGHLTNS